MKIIVTKKLTFPYTSDIEEGSVVDVIDIGNDYYKSEKGHLISKEFTQKVTWDISTLLNISRRFDNSLDGMNLSPDQKTFILTNLKTILKDELK
jgi:hypothetical protein